MIETYLDKQWSFRKYGISSNPSLIKGASPTIEMIEKYPNKDWCWKSISSNKYITLEFIEKYFDKLDLYSGISSEFIEKHDKKFNWFKEGLSNNPVITPEFVQKYINKPWY